MNEHLSADEKTARQIRSISRNAEKQPQPNRAERRKTKRVTKQMIRKSRRANNRL